MVVQSIGVPQEDRKRFTLRINHVWARGMETGQSFWIRSIKGLMMDLSSMRKELREDVTEVNSLRGVVKACGKDSEEDGG